ncbi:unnamed protein product, partial [Mesorhabditis belari]|uniref:Uncharacterized protein n=1 Tax=Mesorhabditis belari TaxID=2138241 RepID=A0AAF3JC74_9BILA
MLTGAILAASMVKDIQLQVENRNPNVFVFEQTYASKASVFAIDESIVVKLGEYRRDKPTLDNCWRPVSRTKPLRLEYFQIGLPANGGMRMMNGFRDRDDQVFSRLLPITFGWDPAN